jgi:hypothetical protein
MLFARDATSDGSLNGPVDASYATSRVVWLGIQGCGLSIYRLAE